MIRLEAAAAATSSNGRSPTSSSSSTGGGAAGNAWARPLQQKKQAATSPPPGMGPITAASSTTKSANAAANGSALTTILRERLLHLSLALVGQKVVVTLKSGVVLEGVFHTFTPFPGLGPEMKNKYVLKECKTVVKQHPEGSAGDDSSNGGNNNNNQEVKDGSTVVVPVEKVAFLHAKSISLEQRATNGDAGFTPGSSSNNEFSTDTEISGTRGARNQDLVAAGSAWTTGGGKTNSRADALAGREGFASANSNNAANAAVSGGLGGNIGEWDQFRANEQLFNVSASYDENLYTTKLDKSRFDSRKIAEAERLAREIEGTASSNFHVAEERGHKLEGDYDEEDRYSGVLTKEGAVRHDISKQSAKTTSTEESSSKEGSGGEAKTVAAAAPKKMNYAAAAAKADTTGKKVVPPGFASKPGTAGAAVTPDSKPGDKLRRVTPDEKKEGDTANGKPTEDAAKSEGKDGTAEKQPPAKDASGSKATADSEEKNAKDDNKAGADAAGSAPAHDDAKKKETEEATPAPKTSKLSASAKSFSFNPSAKTFTPSFGPAPVPKEQPDPNANMHMQPPMQVPHYMHAAPMGQQGKFSRIIFDVFGIWFVVVRTRTLQCFILCLVPYRNDANDEPAISRSALPTTLPWNGTTRSTNATSSTTTLSGIGCNCTSKRWRASPSKRRRGFG
jgi:hypothetical protein